MLGHRGPQSFRHSQSESIEDGHLHPSGPQDAARSHLAIPVAIERQNDVGAQDRAERRDVVYTGKTLPWTCSPCGEQREPVARGGRGRDRRRPRDILEHVRVPADDALVATIRG
jgi:hypothetical protein